MTTIADYVASNDALETSRSSYSQYICFEGDSNHGFGKESDHGEEKKEASPRSLVENECMEALILLRRNSSFFTDNDPIGGEVKDPAYIPEDEIELGIVLGKGSFSSVRALGKVDSNGIVTCNSHLSLSAHSSRVVGEGKREQSYAMKKVRTDIDYPTQLEGVVDLFNESQFLRKLSHPNIVKLKGCGEKLDIEDFYVVLDRFECTLVELLRRLRNQKLTIRNSKLSSAEKKEQKGVIVQKQYMIAQQIASALDYLHSKNIMHRDLKPQNIGIDDRDDVKIFDFGTAKELKPEFKIGEDQYKNTAETGSPRYMAPEVQLSDVYGLPADIYSFTLIFWQVLTMKTPFWNLVGRDDFSYCVHNKGERPKIKLFWPRKIKKILSNGWHRDFRKRPKIDFYYEVIENEYKKHC